VSATKLAVHLVLGMVLAEFFVEVVDDSGELPAKSMNQGEGPDDNPRICLLGLCCA
jgi:hypothetical protein